MKPLEVIAAIAGSTSASDVPLPSSPDAILDSPAFAMPCRLGEATAMLRHAAVEPSDTVALKILLGEEPHTLALARSSAFPELDKLWDCRADVPEPVLLALVERECGPLLQMMENAVRKQLRLVGISHGGTEEAESQSSVAHWELAIGTAGEAANIVRFTLTRSQTVVSALGVLRNLDLSHESIRSIPIRAVAEYAAFALPESDVASLAPGDALLLPEIGTVPPRLVVAGSLVADGNGVSRHETGDMACVVDAEAKDIPLGELLDAAEEPRAVEAKPSGALRLVRNGKRLASGRLDRLGGQPALVVESAP